MQLKPLYQVGDIVWMKTPQHPMWPGKIKSIQEVGKGDGGFYYTSNFIADGTKCNINEDQLEPFDPNIVEYQPTPEICKTFKKLRRAFRDGSRMHSENMRKAQSENRLKNFKKSSSPNVKSKPIQRKRPSSPASVRKLVPSRPERPSRQFPNFNERNLDEKIKILLSVCSRSNKAGNRSPQRSGVVKGTGIAENRNLRSSQKQSVQNVQSAKLEEVRKSTTMLEVPKSPQKLIHDEGERKSLRQLERTLKKEPKSEEKQSLQKKDKNPSLSEKKKTTKEKLESEKEKKLEKSRQQDRARRRAREKEREDIRKKETQFKMQEEKQKSERNRIDRDRMAQEREKKKLEKEKLQEQPQKLKKQQQIKKERQVEIPLFVKSQKAPQKQKQEQSKDKDRRKKLQKEQQLKNQANLESENVQEYHESPYFDSHFGSESPSVIHLNALPPKKIKPKISSPIKKRPPSHYSDSQNDCRSLQKPKILSSVHVPTPSVKQKQKEKQEAQQAHLDKTMIKPIGTELFPDSSEKLLEIMKFRTQCYRLSLIVRMDQKIVDQKFEEMRTIFNTDILSNKSVVSNQIGYILSDIIGNLRNNLKENQYFWVQETHNRIVKEANREVDQLNNLEKLIVSRPYENQASPIKSRSKSKSKPKLKQDKSDQHIKDIQPYKKKKPSTNKQSGPTTEIPLQLTNPTTLNTQSQALNNPFVEQRPLHNDVRMQTTQEYNYTPMIHKLLRERNTTRLSNLELDFLTEEIWVFLRSVDPLQRISLWRSFTMFFKVFAYQLRNKDSVITRVVLEDSPSYFSVQEEISKHKKMHQKWKNKWSDYDICRSVIYFCI